MAAGSETHCNGGFQVALLPMVVLCYWGMQMQVCMAARCFLGMSLQVAKRIVMVVSRCCWVANGGAVLLGHAIADC